MNLKAILLITSVIFLVAITSNLAAGQIEQLQNVTEVDSIKSLTNYDKILRAIIDECSVRSWLILYLNDLSKTENTCPESTSLSYLQCHSLTMV